MELVRFPYDKITSKLSGFVPQNQKVRIIIFFSCSEPGRDKANLAFLKQFGVVPQEFCIANGDAAINILSGLNDFDGLTIVVESVPVNDLIFEDSATQNEGIDSIPRISASYQHLISEQTETISHYFKNNRHEYTGGYVYISGFSELMSRTDEDLFPEAEFLPGYLEVDNRSSLCRIVKQPELSLLMQKMKDVEPLIYNLDDCLDEMNKWESESGALLLDFKHKDLT